MTQIQAAFDAALGAVHGSASIHRIATVATSLSWQDTSDAGSSRLLVTFVGIAAVSLLIICLMLLGAAIGGLIGYRSVMKYIHTLEAKVMPLVQKGEAITAKADTLFADLTPHIKSITSDVQGITAKAGVIAGHAQEISGVYKEKIVDFAPTITTTKETVEEINQTVRSTVRAAGTKTEEQINRVNHMVSDALDATAHATASVQSGIKWPFRQAAGIVSGVRAAVETLAGQYRDTPTPRYKPPVGTYRGDDPDAKV